MNTTAGNSHATPSNMVRPIQTPAYPLRNSRSRPALPRAPQIAHTGTNFDRWQSAIYTTPDARRDVHLDKNIYYERTPAFIMLKNKEIPKFEETDNNTGIFRTYIKGKHLFAYAFKFENGFWYCLLTPLEPTTVTFSDISKLYYLNGWTSVIKRDLDAAREDLFKRRTTIGPSKFPEHIKKYVNFNGQQLVNPVTSLEELLKTFISDVERWEFDISPHKMMITFLRKVGAEHADFVEENAHRFRALAAKTRRSRFGNHRDERAVKQLTCGDFDTQGFVTYEYDKYSMFISKNQRHYLGESIDHILLDATGSLPCPYSQMVNFIYYDTTNKRYRYLGSFLLKESGLYIDTNLWEELLLRLDSALPFKSISVDGEKAMLRALSTLGKTVWGCHFHYTKGIHTFAVSKGRQIRAYFLQIAKYFMFMDNPDEIFKRLTETVKFDGERQLINHIKREYLDLKYFGYSGNLKDKAVLARVTTSAVEGINGSLKYYLRQDRSPITLIKFITDKSQYPMNNCNPTSKYQAVNPNDMMVVLVAMENGQDNCAIATDKFAKKGVPMERWKSAKLRAEQNAAEMKEHYDKEKTIAGNIAASKKIKKLGEWANARSKYKFLRTIGETRKATMMNQINNHLLGDVDADEFGTEIIVNRLIKIEQPKPHEDNAPSCDDQSSCFDDPFIDYIMTRDRRIREFPKLTRPEYSDDEVMPKPPLRNASAKHRP